MTPRSEPAASEGNTPAAADPRFHLSFEAGEGRLELARPLHAGRLRVEALVLSLGRLTGAIELGQGPRRFRHRRSQVVSARVRIPLESAIEEVHVEGTDVRLRGSAEAGRALEEQGLTVASDGDALRIARPLRSVLTEVMVRHGWRVPDDRAARIVARADEEDPGLVLEASA